jgi:hypothetical protein
LILLVANVTIENVTINRPSPLASAWRARFG